MSAELRLADETPAGRVIREFILELATETITVRELIEQRIRDEVARYNAAPPAVRVFQGLVQPADAAATLDGYELRKNGPIDADEQCRRALAAFERNGFLLLANGRQIESLDEPIPVAPETRVAFVKLTPLVGG